MNKTLLLTLLCFLIITSVLSFNVFHFSGYYGFVQVNFYNSMYLIPFVVLLISFGLLLGQQVETEQTPTIDDFNFTHRELEIVEYIIAGKRNLDIAEALFVEVSTVKTHINNIYKKAEVSTRIDLKKKLNKLPKID